jgi:hypothetical protein
MLIEAAIGRMAWLGSCFITHLLEWNLMEAEKSW